MATPQLGVREVSDKEAEDLVHRAFELEREIKKQCAATHGAYWDLAESLFKLHEIKGWKALGYETLAEFLAQPDLGLSEATFQKAVRTWRDLVTVKQLPPSTLREIEPSKAREVVPAVMRGEVDLEDALDDAKALSYRDVIEKYRLINRSRHGQEPDDSAALDADTEPVRVRCPTCRQWTTEDQLPVSPDDED